MPFHLVYYNMLWYHRDKSQTAILRFSKSNYFELFQFKTLFKYDIFILKWKCKLLFDSILLRLDLTQWFQNNFYTHIVCLLFLFFWHKPCSWIHKKLCYLNIKIAHLPTSSSFLNHWWWCHNILHDIISQDLEFKSLESPYLSRLLYISTL